MILCSTTRQIDARTIFVDLIEMESQYVETIANLDGDQRQREEEGPLEPQYRYHYDPTFHADEERVILAYNPVGVSHLFVNLFTLMTKWGNIGRSWTSRAAFGHLFGITFRPYV